MRKNKFIFALCVAFILSGCEGYQLGGPFADKPVGNKGGSMCKHEQSLAVEYAPQQYITVPTCPINEINVARAEGLYEPYAVINEAELTEKPEPWDIDPNDIEGDFPEVENNKNVQNQVVMQNLESRVLAFCRGTQKAIDACVERLSCAGYEKITDVPRVTAKYDLAPNKGYPARRWREGEVAPRW